MTPWLFAHNLDTRSTGIQFADDYLALMAQPAANNQPLVQVGDEVSVTINTTPGPGHGSRAWPTFHF